ncbi:MAG: hypothetical protein CL917_11000 [Deltaproteobacteria bacterium]|nr:hypothetical protein [Deltaproteobacteria bacterium]
MKPKIIRNESGLDRRHLGISLIEVMIALMVLSFGLLTVALMQLHAMQGTSKGRHLTAASMIAREQLEQVGRVPFSALNNKAWGQSEAWMTELGLAQGNVSVVVDQPGGAVQVERVYAVDWKISDVVPQNLDLKNIELSVTWLDENSVNPKSFSLATLVVNNKR